MKRCFIQEKMGFNKSELLLFNISNNATEDTIIRPMFLCKKKLEENKNLVKKYNLINLENKSLDNYFIENSNHEKFNLKVLNF